MKSASCPRLSGKVSAKLTKGARVSKYEKDFIRNGIKYVPVIFE